MEWVETKKKPAQNNVYIFRKIRTSSNFVFNKNEKIFFYKVRKWKSPSIFRQT